METSPGRAHMGLPVLKREGKAGPTDLRASLGWFLFPKAELCVAKLHIASLPSTQGSRSAHQAQLIKHRFTFNRTAGHYAKKIQQLFFLHTVVETKFTRQQTTLKYPMIVNNYCTSNCAASHGSSIPFKSKSSNVF